MGDFTATLVAFIIFGIFITGVSAIVDRFKKEKPSKKELKKETKKED